MNAWRSIRMLVLFLAALSAAAELTGCGSGGEGQVDAGAELTPEEDPTLNPETDSTMQAQ